jgi:two-component system, NarL family, nitrate/nitrite response regulator NarL
MIQHYDGVGMPHRPRQTRPKSPPLTDRQRLVLRMIAEGKRDKAIARELGISTTTVRDYIERILHNLGAVDRPNAVAIAMRKGLLNNKPKT